ncbi:Hsp70 family protein [Mycobacterium saskatchewanense]|uniref:Molecular chaperone n=1 Tax=Mycobacterium saskatchewanense TaxID=220927 RepID=A0AAJ3NT95_9MYCO|nr:Hsp70 family protein [Mycobacterium saskatchewanense]ORW73553.1 molecular chaperone [Mycobacterium saskatchewanense]
MSESLGLSIGVTRLVAARSGSAPVTRSPVVTLFENRPTEVGLPEENPNLTGQGLVLRGFVERVGDRTPLVAADGTKYLGEVLTVEAIEAMARAVGYGTPVTIAIPAYWSETQATALREEFFAQPDLARAGVPPVLVPDATAALAALRAQPGFPTSGVVALCDFGASGTSVTLFDAGSGYQQIGPSVRNTDFSGDALDQLVLEQATAPAATADIASTARIGSQSRLLGECRRAKEHLSSATTATVAAGSGEIVTLSRADFEQLVAEPLDRFAGAVEEVLRRNGIAGTGLAAVATVGGGAAIPLIGRRLAERFGVPIHTAPQPAFSAAVGAAVLGDQQQSAGAPTAAAAAVETPTQMVRTARAADADPVLAWSEDDDDTGEPVPYTGPDMTGQYDREAPKAADVSTGADADRYPAEPGGLPWYKRTALVLSVAGAAAAVLVAVVLALTLGRDKPGPAGTTAPNAPAPPQTVTITGPNDSTTVTVVPAPPPPSTQPTETTSAAPPPSTTTNTTTNPPTTTTAAPPTTTSQQPTTTQPTTTAAPTTARDRPLPPRFDSPFRR